MYRIAICDDEATFASYLKRKVADFFHYNKLHVCIDVFTSSTDILLSNEKYSLYFLDVRWPDTDGMKLASVIRAADEKEMRTSSIIFISSINDAVFESFRYMPLRYIRKEMLEEELEEALNAFLEHVGSVRDGGLIEICEKGERFLLEWRKIYYVEIFGHYLHFFCSDRTYHVRSSLSAYENYFIENYFIRLHQGCFVNMLYIKNISADHIVLTNGLRLNIARRRKTDVKNTYMQWERKHTHVLTV